MAISALQTDNVMPTTDEIEKFQQRLHNDDASDSGINIL